MVFWLLLTLAFGLAAWQIVPVILASFLVFYTWAEEVDNYEQC
jgi:hypothetical protein